LDAHIAGGPDGWIARAQGGDCVSLEFDAPSP